ncbi:hypothetical protein ACJ73_09647 [Blastomyces percursus]|uniref:Uncharacterized protein n=1 Tax=Blastomyces percursus TaxID=1658174 RepID=A0A1J9Q3Y8_9EURO|nr:hypothetical protein ACJ73_09647 [Blastomyces percursus]
MSNFNKESNTATILLTGPENFDHWDRALRNLANSKQVYEVLFDGKEQLKEPNWDEEPKPPKVPERDTAPPPAASTRSATA